MLSEKRTAINNTYKMRKLHNKRNGIWNIMLLNTPITLWKRTIARNAPIAQPKKWSLQNYVVKLANCALKKNCLGKFTQNASIAQPKIWNLQNHTVKYHKCAFKKRNVLDNLQKSAPIAQWKKEIWKRQNSLEIAFKQNWF